VRLIIVDEAVRWAIHRFYSQPLLVTRQQIQILLIVLVVATYFPQVDIEHVRRDYFLEAASLVLCPHQLHELIVDYSAMG